MSLKGLSIVVIAGSFPSLTNTFVIKHLVALKEAGARLTVVSGQNQSDGKCHPAIAAHDLKSHVRYIRVAPRSQLLLQLASYCRPDYSLSRVASSALTAMRAQEWRRHGFRYLVRELAKLKLLSDGPFDLVHSHELKRSYEYLFLKDTFGFPLITSYHGAPIAGWSELEAPKRKAVFRSGDLFLANTEFARRELSSLGCPEGKIQVLPTGIPLDEFPFLERRYPDNGKITLLSVSRLSAEKGLDIAVRAVSQLVRSQGFRNIEYKVVGSGPEAGKLEALIGELGLEGYVKLLGAATTAEVVEYLHQAHIMLVPSRRESQGVVIQEAQATGLPVIATRTGGIPEVVRDGETGLLVEEGNAGALADAIAYLIQNYDVARGLARAGRPFVEKNYDQSKINGCLFRLYEELLASQAIRIPLTDRHAGSTSHHPSPY
jgi:colanic acid/amylovoran biosynthesis glycosyltransferase